MKNENRQNTFACYNAHMSAQFQEQKYCFLICTEGASVIFYFVKSAALLKATCFAIA